MYDIKELERSYEEATKANNEIATGIADAMRDLNLENVKTTIADAVLQMEQISGVHENSALSRIPFIGKYVKQARQKVHEEQVQNGNIREVVDHLFNALYAKKENILTVMETMYTLQQRLIDEAEMLEQKNIAAEEIINNEKGIAVSRAKNLIVQVKQSLIKTRDRIQIIDGTIRSAEASAVKISSFLPSLRGELIAELAIGSGLKEIREFRKTFDATIDVIEELSVKNNTDMKQVMLDVVDLAVSTGTNLKRLESTNNDRINFQNQLQSKMAEAAQSRDAAITTLSNIENNQNLLNFKAEE